MNKIVLSLLWWIFPTLVLAADNSFNPAATNSLSFAPPPGDYSVIFLGNIFGIVDGVLHGTGSQIMGNMFGVFNSAVLALGGIVIMYTLLVSTMNTAQEGQMLGQKWSSIWVPMRSTLGLALLIPKASGYCLMQIFVMWIVLQGVGAADKIWSAALSYLNRGGVIVQAQMNPTTSAQSGGILCSTSNGITKCSYDVATGAGVILAGQVCMLGLQTILENQRQNYLDSKQSNSGPCYGTPNDTMKKICNTAVPDFLSSVNAVSFQNNPATATPLPGHNYILPMPNFDANSDYAVLNGICGNIQWAPYTAANNIQKAVPTITNSELQTAKLSRAIAIQQMYMDLASIAQIMVNNDPSVTPFQNLQPTDTTNFSVDAVQQFGVPYTADNQPCGKGSLCQAWGQDPSNTSSAPLFNGTEFQGAIADYNGIMMPTLNLVKQSADKGNAQAQRAFIQDANMHGWILAGSYFFDLAKLNAVANQSPDLVDSNTGLDSSQITLDAPMGAFGSGGTCGGDFASLCEWMNKDSSKVYNVMSLVNGANLQTGGLPPLTLPQSSATDPVLAQAQSPYNPISGELSSTVYGYINNSMSVQLPGQPGMTPPAFAMKFNINIDIGKFQLQKADFPCGKLKVLTWHTCLGQMFGDLFYNVIMRNVFNFFLNMMAQVINGVIMTFLFVPLQGIAAIFKTGVSIIQQPAVNPVIALANMGVNYINFANELWIILLTITVTTILIPWFGIFILALVMMAMPLLIAWLGIMVSIGFVTAYYIPFLPYMIFTFGSIAWLMVVIEAMVAAPIVALGVTHPEGHDAFGKGEQAIMILMNVFLRPSMMIIGYIAAIALSYVSVWIINAGFANAMSFVQGSASDSYAFQWSTSSTTAEQQAGNIDTTQGYTGWAGIYGYFFSILVYTTMYLTVVQKSFQLIVYLPDKVLRWIGGQPESVGQEAAQWGEEVKGKVGEGAKETTKAAGQIDSQLEGYAQKGLAAAKSKFGGKGSAKAGGGQQPPSSTPSPGGGAE